MLVLLMMCPLKEKKYVIWLSEVQNNYLKDDVLINILHHDA
jgi:hypothetical protein